jgi:hypothetical protein
VLAFQLIKPHQITIYCDRVGMATLRRALEVLEARRASHLHLWGPTIGGNELDEKTPFGDAAVSEVIINYQESAE